MLSRFKWVQRKLACHALAVAPSTEAWRSTRCFWNHPLRSKTRGRCPEATPRQFSQNMRTAILSLIAAPLALMAAGNESKAFDLYGYGTGYGSGSFYVNGPNGYHGSYYQMGNFHTYSDNYGSTTCSGMGQFINCW